MNKNWSAFIENLALDKNEENLIKNLNINNVRIIKEKKIININCFLEKYFDLELMSKFEKSAENSLNPYKVNLYLQSTLSSAEEIAGYLDYLNYRTLKEYSFLNNNIINYKKNEMEIVLKSEFQKELFYKNKVKEYIADLVEFTFPDFHDLKLQIVDNIEEQNKILKEVEKKKNKEINLQKQINGGNKNSVSGKSHLENFLVLYGNTILEAGVEAGSVRENIKNIVLVGKMADLKIKTLSNEKTMVSFKLLSKRNGIYCKIFISKNKEKPELKIGKLVKVKGNIEFDRYINDYVLIARSINITEHEKEIDDFEEKRVELHLHTKMSFLDANLELPALFKKMKDLGHDTVAVTDHGVVQIFPEAYAKGKEFGIKVIFGLEGYLYDDINNKDYKASTNHVIILVKNQTGLKNLYRLVSESHLNFFYRKPRIPKSLLNANREGLIIGSACEAGEVFQGVVQNKLEEELIEIVKYYDYLEVQPITNNMYMVRDQIVNSKEDLIAFNKKVIELGEKTDIPVLATGDVHFLDREDGVYRAILMKSKGYKDVIQPELYYRSTKEMLEDFNYLSEEKALELVVKNPRLIADTIAEIKPIPDGLHTPVIGGAEEQVKELTLKTAEAIYGNPLPAIVGERLDKELNSIITHGFSVLYLIAHKLVKKSNEDGYMVGSRGSVGSSLVATMMGITEVNPLLPHYVCPKCRHSEFIDENYDCGIEMSDKNCPVCGEKYNKDGFNIPFETFLGFKGDKTPDIDLNFSGEYQLQIHKYTEELFGKGNVFKAGTIGTVAKKTAAGLVRKYFEEELINYEAKDIEISALASGCVGVKRTTGQHPGGLIIVPENMDILDFTPVQRPADDINSDITTTHFDYHSIDSCLVKLDLLGHDDPTMIKYLEETTGFKVKDIPLDDPGVLSLFRSPEALNLEESFVETGSLGLPEFGTKFVRKMLLDTKPAVFSDLIRISGFSHGTDVWVNNARDLIIGGKVKLKEAISTRDDIMVYLQNKGLEDIKAFNIMEDVRKGKKLKVEYEKLMISHKIPEWYIDSCNKITYMFPKAHATAYVITAFRLGYYKINFKEAFYASYFSIRGESFDYNLFVNKETIKNNLKKFEVENNLNTREKELKNLLEIAYEMYLRKVEFLPLDLYDSEAKAFKVIGDKLLPPFSSIPGLGEKVSEAIIIEREKRKFLSIDDLKRRCKINNSIIEEMKKLNLLAGLPESEQLAFFS